MFPACASLFVVARPRPWTVLAYGGWVWPARPVSHRRLAQSISTVSLESGGRDNASVIDPKSFQCQPLLENASSDIYAEMRRFLSSVVACRRLLMASTLNMVAGCAPCKPSKCPRSGCSLESAIMPRPLHQVLSSVSLTKCSQLHARLRLLVAGCCCSASILDGFSVGYVGWLWSTQLIKLRPVRSLEGATMPPPSIATASVVSPF